MSFGPIQWLRDQFLDLPLVSEDLEGRIVIVTGANTGLGFECAMHFLRMKPAKLILAVRSIEKGQAAALRMIDETKETRPDIVEVWQLDMASFVSVQAFAQRVETLPRLDIAVLNSGVNTREWRTTGDGYEISLQVNVISTGLLATLLLPSMQRTTSLPAASVLKPHLVIVSSDAHYLAGFPEHTAAKPISALNDQARFRSSDRYYVTKLLDVFIVQKLARLSKASGIVISTVNPAFCRSDLNREVGMFMGLILEAIYFIFARTGEMGARNYVWAALKDIPSGSFVNSCRVDPVSKLATSEIVADKVWNELVEIWTPLAPSVADIVKA